jgi:hypothetical protein
MISTNGNGPKLANIIRRRIAGMLPPNAGDAVTKVGILRRKLRKVAPDLEEGPKRMQWYVLEVLWFQGRANLETGCHECAKNGVLMTYVL